MFVSGTSFLRVTSSPPGTLAVCVLPGKIELLRKVHRWTDGRGGSRGELGPPRPFRACVGTSGNQRSVRILSVTTTATAWSTATTTIAIATEASQRGPSTYCSCASQWRCVADPARGRLRGAAKQSGPGPSRGECTRHRHAPRCTPSPANVPLLAPASNAGSLRALRRRASAQPAYPTPIKLASSDVRMVWLAGAVRAARRVARKCGRGAERVVTAPSKAFPYGLFFASE